MNFSETVKSATDYDGQGALFFGKVYTECTKNALPNRQYAERFWEKSKIDIQSVNPTPDISYILRMDFWETFRYAYHTFCRGIQNRSLGLMKEEGKVITLRFDGKKKEHDLYKRSKDAMMVRKYMEFRDNGLLYESLFPTGIKYHPDIYYDFDSYMWRAVRPGGEMSQGDLRSMVWFFTGLNVQYRYVLDGEEKKTSMFETVVRDAVENPESFSILGFRDDYSVQEWSYLDELCEKLISSRHGERYQGAKLEQWING